MPQDVTQATAGDVAIPTEVVALDYKSLIREGAKFKLIARPDAWFAYRRQRNLTSHTYDESVAEEVAKNAVEFLEDARQLLLALQKMSDSIELKTSELDLVRRSLRTQSRIWKYGPLVPEYTADN